MSQILLTNFDVCEKINAHKEGLKHFAFSVFLFNQQKQLLLQQRSNSKYHSGGLWTNSCCSHFRNIEEFNNKEQTIKNRIKEELGVDIRENLKFVKEIEYNLKVGELIENEHDFIFYGIIENNYDFNNFNQDEVKKIDFVDFQKVIEDTKKTPVKYTKWFIEIINKVIFPI